MTDPTCPPPLPGQTPSGQTDLNLPPTPAEMAAFTQVHMGTLGDLCQWGLSSQIITGVLMQFMRNHFSTPSTIMMPGLKKYVWTPATPTTATSEAALPGLLITNFTTFNPMSGQLPAIVVKRGQQDSSRQVLHDISQNSIVQRNDGIRNFVRFIKGTHTLYAMSNVDAETEALGDEVFDSLSFLSPIFVEQLPFHDFEVVSKGEIGVLDDLGNKLGIPITINYVYEYGWSVQSLAPKIKTVGLFAQ